MNDAAPMHVLIVEDEPLAAQLISRYLAAHELRISTAGSGNAAIRMLEEEAVDVIVTDLRMPDGDGIQLIRTVRERGDGLPIIVMTGQVLRDSETEALEAGASLVLRKPLDLSALGIAVLGYQSVA